MHNIRFKSLNSLLQKNILVLGTIEISKTSLKVMIVII